MKITDRTFRGLIVLSVFLMCLLIWTFFNGIYPNLREDISLINLPEINADIFLLVILFISVYTFLIWSTRNKLWHGIRYSINHYLIIKSIRRQILNAGYDETNLNRRIVKLPKIKINFNNNKVRNAGSILIENSIRFDQKLENMRIDSAIKNYVCERQYLSENRNWYVYEFYSIKSFKKIEFKTEQEYLHWTNETSDDYNIRLDERTTCPMHHTGISGQTGSGKSFLIQMLIDQVINKNIKHELFIIDPKRADVYEMSNRKFGKKKTADKTNAIDLIKIFHKEMIDRQIELKKFLESNPNKTFKDAKFPALILLIDEFGALRDSWNLLPKKERDEVNSILSDIAFMGRQCGCLLWIATQQMNAQTIPTSIREQLVLKIVIGDSDEQTYRTLFASSVDIPPVQFSAGLGLYSYPELASIDKPKLLAVPYCSYLE